MEDRNHEGSCEMVTGWE